MPREGVPYPGGAICRLKCELKNLWQAVGAKLHSINGVPGDGAGNVKILAGSNVTIANDAAHNEITISSAEDAVKSVNGVLPDQDGDITINTGVMTVNGDAPDQDGNVTVNTGVMTVNGDAPDQDGNVTVNTGILKIGNVGPNTSGTITIAAGSNVSVTEDGANNTITIASTASGGVTPQDVQDALDSYSPMVRTSGNQLIAGNKTFQGELGVSRLWSFYGGGDNPGLKLMNTNPWNITHSEIEFIQFAGTFGAGVSFTAIYNSDGTVTLNAKIRNSNGTIKTVQLAKGDVI